MGAGACLLQAQPDMAHQQQLASFLLQQGTQMMGVGRSDGKLTVLQAHPAG